MRCPQQYPLALFALEFEPEWPLPAETPRSGAEKQLMRVGRMATIVWVAAFLASAAMQELGATFVPPHLELCDHAVYANTGQCKNRWTYGEVLLGHLAPPLVIILAARRASYVARRLLGMPTQDAPKHGNDASVDGVLLEDQHLPRDVFETGDEI